MATLRIGQLAQRAGVNIDTIRFYERQGILPEPPRRESGYRDYPPETVGLIRFIKRAQELGFTLREARELLNLRSVPRGICGDVLKHARSKVAQIDEKIRDLQAMRDALSKLIADCSRRGSIACCPIIESLAGESDGAVRRVRAPVNKATVGTLLSSVQARTAKSKLRRVGKKRP